MNNVTKVDLAPLYTGGRLGERLVFLIFLDTRALNHVFNGFVFDYFSLVLNLEIVLLINQKIYFISKVNETLDSYYFQM